MKAEIRIPTTQYGYINIIVEPKDGYDLENIIGLHNEAVKEYADSLKTPENAPGLNPKDWHRVLDTYLVENRVEEEDYTGMSDKQKLLINEIKKSLNRVAAKGEQGTRADSSHRIIN